MDLKELQKKQKEFDKEYFKKFWDIKNEKEFIDKLKYVVVALSGEWGEFANIVKKIIRDNENLDEKPSEERLEKLKDELTDVFIYVLITANLLNVDLEKEYFRKMSFNKERFEKYKNNSK